METKPEYDTPQTPKPVIVKTQATAFVSAEDIIEWSEELGYRSAGIYFLIDYGEIVYVGQSKTAILSRIARHLADKQFDRVTCLQYPADHDLDALETEYIWRIQPKYNTRMPPNPHYMRKRRLKELLGVDGTTLNQLIRQAGLKSRLGGYYDIRPLREL